MENHEITDLSLDSVPPAKEATTKEQKSSIAELFKWKKYSLYESINEENLTNYHKISCRPITKKAEDDMELVSDVVTWGERYLHHWEEGIYICSRCSTPLYSSNNKYKGPCIWPSFRKPVSEIAVSTQKVYPYNKYIVTVKEVYCGKCDLFIGHQFEDAKEKGDTSPEAHWRH
jgi:peptide-methionine (R)-S-oxide reductase